uniref:Uncharacterized protein n=1 Tax=Rhipicephalus zambeziensis TaxID=60191 RepID=A0A224Y6H5_9ACAR
MCFSLQGGRFSVNARVTCQNQCAQDIATSYLYPTHNEQATKGLNSLKLTAQQTMLQLHNEEMHLAQKCTCNQHSSLPSASIITAMMHLLLTTFMF